MARSWSEIEAQRTLKKGMAFADLGPSHCQSGLIEELF